MYGDETTASTWRQLAFEAQERAEAAEVRVKALEGAIAAAKAYLDDEAYSCCRDELSAALISEQGN